MEILQKIALRRVIFAILGKMIDLLHTEMYLHFLVQRIFHLQFSTTSLCSFMHNAMVGLAS